MPPRPATDRDSTVHYEPLRASVLDAFEQLGAFNDDSGIVEWIFPEVHEQKELQRSRIKLPEIVEVPQPEPEAPRKSRTSRFFNIRSRSKSKPRPKKESPTLPTAPTKLKPKKSRSSPNLRESAAKSPPPTLPAPPSPLKQTATTATRATSVEHKSRLSIFPRKAGAQSLDQPRPSISDEEWQQITMTGSIADYETNPFLGMDPHGTNDVGAGPVKRDGLQRHFSRFTNSFTRSTPTSPTREHPAFPLSNPTSPTPMSPTSDPTTPTGPMATSPRASEHSNVSTSTLPSAPTSPTTIREVPRDDTPESSSGSEDALEPSSQMDHVRMSLSDISEGDASETSTLSIKGSRKSHVSAAESAAPATPSLSPLPHTPTP
ncbi:hypothetical protein DFH09DRAFT_1256763 [Mycena vulgaris]|nr:hypothetical protein DFH09DRAFT_1256763 [Mycena vulgaris]